MNVDLRGAFWTPSAAILGSASKMYERIVRSIFANGEQGFAYDPNDLTTLFQDTTGTIPVTSTGQPVGLVLDKSKGLKLGVELFNQFNSTLNSTLSQNTLPCVVTSTVSGGVFGVAAANIFQVGVYKIEFTWSGNSDQAEMGVQLPNGNDLSLGTGVTGSFSKVMNFTSTGSFSITKSAPQVGQTFTVSAVSIKKIAGNHAYQTVSASRPVLRQTPILGNELVVNGDFSSGLTNVAPRNVVTTAIVAGALKVTNAGTFYGYAEMALPTAVGKTYLFRGDVVASSGAGAAFHIASLPSSSDIATNVEGAAAAAGVMFTAKTTTTYLSLKTPSNATGAWRIFDNISIKEITGYRTDQNYLAFDGVDDFLQTNNIDFTMTDKVSLFVGVRKLSDATTAVVAELGTDSITVNGTFGLFAPAGTGVTKFQFLSRCATGTNYAQALNAIYNAPISAVVRGIGSIADQNSELHVNRALAGKSPTGLTGAGNYSASPLYIGRRAGQYIPFSGHLYGLIGVGRLTTDGETLAVERELAKATGVTLNV